MSTVPSNVPAKIEFYEIHNVPWAANAVGIGLTAPIVADVVAKTEAAREAYTAQQTALAAARAATTAVRNAIAELNAVGANAIKQIRATAERTGDPDIYSLAQIPPPAIPSARPAPGEVYKIKAELDGNGALILKWKCDGSVGAMYQVYRSLGGSVNFVSLGGSGSKSFTDNTIPLGATQLTYKIQAVRSTSQGGWVTFNVLFGTNAGGSMTATVVSPSTTVARLAA